MRNAFGLAALGALTAAGVALPAPPAAAVCSVFDRHPCAPTVCSVFQRRPCIPEVEYPIGQDLRLTIDSASAESPGTGTAGKNDDGTERRLDTIRDLFAALRSCWVPPEPGTLRGMQMSVRFSFKRSGQIIDPPRVTYSNPEASEAQKAAYRDAITAALERCTPMPFTSGLGGAIAGRPIAIRFIDNRSIEGHEP